MPIVNMLKAKTQLSRLISAVESGEVSEIVIARNGKPAAKLVAIGTETKRPRRLGLLDGKFPNWTGEYFDEDNEEIAALFSGPDE